MSENLRKLIGVAVMVAIVVVGVVATNDDDTYRTRNRALTDRDVATSSAAPDRSSEADDRSTYVFDYDDEDSSGVFDYDDEDSSGNESERVTFALELNDEAETGGGASECCRLNAFEIQLLKERIQELESEVAEWAGKSGDSVAAIQKELSGLSSTLEDHLAKESVGSNYAQLANVEEIVIDLVSVCQYLDPSKWEYDYEYLAASQCVRKFLDGFPIEVAKQVVLIEGTYGFLHRYDYGEMLEPWGNLPWPDTEEYLSAEACEPFFGYGTFPRFALALDTHNGNVVYKQNAGNGWYSQSKVKGWKYPFFEPLYNRYDLYAQQSDQAQAILNLPKKVNGVTFISSSSVSDLMWNPAACMQE
ncbi:MAG: hypothetical protein ACJZ4L_04880 [Candidatus Poriferisodalaceae bacterium]